MNTDPLPKYDSAKNQPKSVTSEDLLGNAAELVIVHAGEQYRLRVTKNNRLILTK